MFVPKPTAKTWASMNDRLRWLSAWLKLRQYELVHKKKAYLRIFYITTRATRDYKYAVIKLFNINNKLVTPLPSEIIQAIIQEEEAKESLTWLTNQYIIKELEITENEEKILQIGSNMKHRADGRFQNIINQIERSQRQQRMCQMYQDNSSMIEIASQNQVSRATAYRVLADKLKDSKSERNAEILRQFHNGVPIVSIARCLGCSRGTVYNVLNAQKFSAVPRSEESRNLIVETHEFIHSDLENLFQLYSEKSTHSTLDSTAVLEAQLKRGNRNLLIIGPAGCGKSQLLRNYLNSLSEEEKAHILVIAPTGKAADCLNGITAHTAFELSTGVLPDTKITKIPSTLKAITTIIIDEISMLRIDAFSRIIKTIRYMQRKRKQRIRIIAVGDFGQLPPVATKEDIIKLKEFYPKAKGIYAFHSTEWEKLHFQICKLNKIYRQGDPELIQHLTEIKYGKIAAIEWFNKNTSQITHPDGVYICPTNQMVDLYNQAAIQRFDKSEIVDFEASIEGIGSDTSLPCPRLLKIGVGMKVMTICNTSQYKNGSFGIIVGIRKNSVIIKFENGKSALVKPKTFQLENGASYTQLPIIHAYALTVNKAQGCTFEHINIVGGFFAPGQLYVALSRCRTRDGIHLVNKLTTNDLIVDKDALRMTI